MTTEDRRDDGPPVRSFPIQRDRYERHAPRSIPWVDAEIAYVAYHRLYSGQTLERLAERGGFGWTEYLALNDTAAWMRSNPRADNAGIHHVLDGALTARRAMVKTETEASRVR